MFRIMCYDFANCQNQRQGPEDATNLALFFARGNLSFWAAISKLMQATPFAYQVTCTTSTWGMPRPSFLYMLVLLHALNAVHHLDLMRIITEDVYWPLLLAHIQFMENIASNG